MDAIELLDRQHEDVEALFEALAGGSRDQQTLFNELADLLAIHAAIEERHFYPAVRARRTEEILIESLGEHLQIKRALADLLMMGTTSERFAAKLEVLREEVEHHVEEERSDLFPKVRRLCDADFLEALGQEMTATIAELEERPLPPRADVPAQLAIEPPLEPHGAFTDVLGNLLGFLTAPFRLVAALIRSATPRRPRPA
jgi:Hemerythrin HHE cation binding domain